MGYLILLQKHWGAQIHPTLFIWKLAKEIIKYPMYYSQFNSLNALFQAVNYKIIKGLIFNAQTGKWYRLTVKRDLINDIKLLKDCMAK